MVTASSVYLTWRRRFDGNAAIIEYTVECKLTSQRWEQSTKRVVLGSAPGFNWTGLRPASKYNFRVYSRNALGTSEPSVFINTETREGGKFRLFIFFGGGEGRVRGKWGQQD